jgi:hypothetical protein
VEPLLESVDKEVCYQADEEDNGVVYIGWRGPLAVIEHNKYNNLSFYRNFWKSLPYDDMIPLVLFHELNFSLQDDRHLHTDGLPCYYCYQPAAEDFRPDRVAVRERSKFHFGIFKTTSSVIPSAHDFL